MDAALHALAALPFADVILWIAGAGLVIRAVQIDRDGEGRRLRGWRPRPRPIIIGRVTPDPGGALIDATRQGVQ